MREILSIRLFLLVVMEEKGENTEFVHGDSCPGSYCIRYPENECNQELTTEKS